MTVLGLQSEVLAMKKLNLNVYKYNAEDKLTTVKKGMGVNRYWIIL